MESSAQKLDSYPVTLAVLTWKAPITLQRTLESLRPILSLFTEHFVVCQESDPAEIALAKQTGFRVVATHENIGIQNGLKRAVSEAQNEFVLMLENDADYVGGNEGIEALREALDQMTTTPIDHIRLGQLGETPNAKYSRFWKHARSPRRRLLSHLRWHTANTQKYEALSSPDIQSSGSFSGFVKVSDTFWLTTSKYVSWTNHAFLTRESFFLGRLLPFAEAHPSYRLVNGKPDLEHPINCRRNRRWWSSQGFSIGISYPGLFGHSRHDRTPEDEKGCS